MCERFSIFGWVGQLSTMTATFLASSETFDLNLSSIPQIKHYPPSFLAEHDTYRAHMKAKVFYDLEHGLLMMAY